MNSNLNPSTEFDSGQIVCLKADPSLRGPVIEVLPGTPENRFSVWVDGKISDPLCFAVAT